MLRLTRAPSVRIPAIPYPHTSVVQWSHPVHTTVESPCTHYSGVTLYTLHIVACTSAHENFCMSVPVEMLGAYSPPYVTLILQDQSLTTRLSLSQFQPWLPRSLTPRMYHEEPGMWSRVFWACLLAACLHACIC